MKKNKYIILIDHSVHQVSIKLFHDCLNHEDISVIYDTRRMVAVKRLLAHNKIRDRIGSHFDFVTYEKNNLYKEIKKCHDKYKEVTVIITNMGIGYNPYFPYTLRKYKKEFVNVKYVALYLDIFSMCERTHNMTNELYRQGIFDQLYTIEKADADTQGMSLIWTPYSYCDEFSKIPIVNDLYFCGASKHRGAMLAEIAAASQQSSVKTSMDVVCQEDLALIEQFPDVIHVKGSDQYMPYSMLLTRTLQANCILDIVQPDQRALTLRPYEAVVYGRKLLTNNPTIFNFPYYNPEYMQYFDRVSNIDWNWVRTRKMINYHYQGDFSPMKLLDIITTKTMAENSLCRLN